MEIESLARSTLGLTGADLANLVNQAAIHGSVRGADFVTRQDLEMAEDKIRMGPERRSLELKDKNKEVIAYHEAGHALVSLYTEGRLSRIVSSGFSSRGVHRTHSVHNTR